jgi:hypothetical protein
MTTPSQPTTVADIKNFTRAMFSDTLARMSGPLSVPATGLALWVSNETAKILLGMLAFVSLVVTAYRLWKSEHNKVVERNQTKSKLLDDIAALRDMMVGYRIEMQRDFDPQRFDRAAWQQKYNALQTQIAAKIEELAGKAEASAFRSRGNISRETRPGREGTFKWDVLIDTCIYDLDYLKDFIHAYARGPDRGTS